MKADTKSPRPIDLAEERKKRRADGDQGHGGEAGGGDAKRGVLVPWLTPLERIEWSERLGLADVRREPKHAEARPRIRVRIVVTTDDGGDGETGAGA